MILLSFIVLPLRPIVGDKSINKRTNDDHYPYHE